MLTIPAAGQKLTLSIAKMKNNSFKSDHKVNKLLNHTDNRISVVIQVTNEFFQKPETTNAAL